MTLEEDRSPRRHDSLMAPCDNERYGLLGCRVLGQRGCFHGGTALLSGTAGAGKTSMALSAAIASAAREELKVVFAFEQSPSQIRGVQTLRPSVAASRTSDLALACPATVARDTCTSFR